MKIISSCGKLFSLLMLVVLVTVAAPAAFAQDDYSKFEIFGGYTLEIAGEFDNKDTDDSKIDDSRIMNGFTIAGAYNFNEIIGLESMFRWNTGTVGKVSGKCTDMEVSGSSGTCTAKVKRGDMGLYFGPRFTFRNSSKVTPFVHVLAGWSHNSLSGKIEKDGKDVTTALVKKENDNLKSNGFGMVLGGGLDLSLNDHWSIRLIQADYNLARGVDPTKNDDSVKNDYEKRKMFNNFDLSWGISYRF